MDQQTFTLEINKLRRQHKNKWYYWSGIVENKKIEIKAYETWLQIYRVNGIDYSGLMDISVKDFNKTLDKPFNDLPPIHVTE